MKKTALFLFLGIFFYFGCSVDDENPIQASNCDQTAQIIEENAFSSVSTNNYGIQNVVLNGNCLSVTISSSGCDASSWLMHLYSHNNFTAVFPLQRFAKIELVNNELCLAVFSKTVSFDLVPFQVQNQNQVTINLEGWNEQIVYNY